MKTRHCAVIFFVGFLLFILIFFRKQVWDICAPIIYALVLTYLANPFVNMCQKKIKREVGIILFYLIIVAALAILIWCIFPAIIESVSSIMGAIPGFLEKTKNIFYGKYEAVFSYIAKSVGGELSRVSDSLVRFLTNTFSFFANLIIAVVLSFFFLKDVNKLKEGCLMLLPSAWHRKTREIAREIHVVLSGFVRGQLIVAAILSVITSLYLWLLGINYPLVLGILAGVLDIIPNFGAVLASVPILIVAYLSSPQKALWALLLMICVQFLENQIISPKINADSVGISPASAIIAIYISAKLFGFFGILFGVPLFCIAKIIFRRVMARVSQ